MATVINHPDSRADDGFGGMLVGAIILVVAALLFFMFILPSIRANNAGTQDRTLDVNVQLPAGANNNAPAPAPSQPTSEPAPSQ